MAGDPTKVAPHVYKTMFENDRVRILEGRMAPGDVTEMHTHPDHIAVAMKDAKFKFRLASGDEAEGQLAAGQAMFVEGADHSTENTSGEAMHVVLIELK